MVAYGLDGVAPEAVVIALAATAIFAWVPWSIAVMFAAVRREPGWPLTLLGSPLAFAPVVFLYYAAGAAARTPAT
jgi:hypothetical protein